jgi:hypothetical protein
VSDGESLWFIAARAVTTADTGDPVAPRALCLIRVNTPLGAPHVACPSRALGLRWIDLMGVAGQACLVRGEDLHGSMHFDLASHGVLVFDTDAALDAYLFDVDAFDYATAIRHPRVVARSADPW